MTFLLLAAAAWTVLACIGASGIACFVGRARRRLRQTTHYTDWSLAQPDLPEPVLPADATVENLERAVYDGLFRETIRREFPQYRSAA